jgi:hypothetical protein
MTKRRLTNSFLTALVLHAGVALADDTAESALARGKVALKAGRIHEACDAFEASSKLDARIDTELSLASCYAQDGKPITAARLYRRLADKDSDASRRQSSIAKAAKLEASAPKLRFAINPMPAGLVIKVDGVEVPATGDVLVDQGPHEVIATAPGYAGHASAPVDRDRVIVDVIIRMEPVAEAAPAPAAPAPMQAPTTPAPAAEPTGAATTTMDMHEHADHRRRNGMILGGGGVALLAGAAVLWHLSSNKFDEEHALCPMSRCATQADLDHAHSLLSDGRALRGTSLGLGIGSGLLLIAGGYLLLAPHERDTRISFQVQPSGAAIGYTASF